jgi:hypothetical protein
VRGRHGGSADATIHERGVAPAFGRRAVVHVVHVRLPTVVDHGPGDSGMVALTFDSNMTDAMLAELDRHQVGSFDNRAVIGLSAG